MGDGADAEQLYPLEEAITKQAMELGLHHVARLRNHGRWQLFYYGPGGAESALRRAAKRAVPTHRGHTVGSKNDHDWTCYFEFLCPDEERWQWILDRRLVEALTDHGDPLTKPRRVDHSVAFSAEQGRAAFLAAVTELGFETVAAEGKTGSRRRYSAQIHRVDSVELEDIHNTVMELKLLAEEHGGDYEGWETTVEKSLN
jgi:regulator of RNase E activity RraB